MHELEWEDMGVKVDGLQLLHLRFVDDIELITPSISQGERMLANLDRVCRNIGLQLILTKTIFMRNERLRGSGREVNMANDLAPELGRKKRAVWRSFNSVEEVAKKTKDVRLRAHLSTLSFFLS
ncbi:unnamed protein product [Heligmosomoides polygyrus]|uniref:Reverse transcriptase domain-containing protein n=1 Tax=Heligmosomoides polygyrus TaxID=6339 RepID=A0A183F3H6_HELPZ|nr:unnamed protein product [Heligmosomoides polygyrus]